VINMNIHTRCIIVLALIALILLSSIPPIEAYCNTEKKTWFRIVREVGGWSKIENTTFESNYSKGIALLEICRSDLILGSWSTSIYINLDSKGGYAYGYVNITIPELKLEILYSKTVNDSGFLGIGGFITNSLIIKLNSAKVYELRESSTWPFKNRLDTRIYITLWRLNETTLSVVVEDYYGKINDRLSIHWSKDFNYHGEPLTILMTIYKDSINDAKISVDLYFNKIIEDKIYNKAPVVSKLDYGSSTLFNITMGILLILLTIHILFRPSKERAEEGVKVRKAKKK